LKPLHPTFQGAFSLAPIALTLLLTGACRPDPVRAEEPFGSDYLPVEAPDYAYELLSGEFNGDGRPDFACLDGRRIWTILARRAGGFDPPVLIESGERISDAVPVELNQDGLTDFIGINREGRRVGYQLTRAGGGLDSFEVISGPGRVNEFAVLDFDGDGQPDLATMNGDSSRVDLYRNAGPAGWLSHGSIPRGRNYEDLLVGDYDGDQLPDLIMTFRDERDRRIYPGVRWIGLPSGPSFNRGTPDTLELEESVSLDRTRLLVVDLDQDGHSELVESQGRDGIQVWSEAGPGRWKVTSQVRQDGAYYDDLAASDLDGDGFTDLISIDPERDLLLIHPGTGGLNFGPAMERQLPEASGGLLLGSWLFQEHEVACASFGEGVVAIVSLETDARPTQVTRLNPPESNPTAAIPADMDEDGRLDLVIAALTSRETGTIWMAMGTGERHFDYREAPTGFPATSLVVGDFNGDRHQDVIAASAERGAIWYFEGDGAGHLGLGRELYRGERWYWLTSEQMVAADLDHDGRLDLALPGPTNELLVFANRGGASFGAPFVATVDGTIMSLVASDEDGRPGAELYLLTDSPGVLRAFLFSRSNGLLEQDVQASVGRSEGHSMTDVDGDCVKDLVIALGGNDRVAIQKGLGRGQFGHPTLQRMSRNLRWAAAADLTGDGYTDLVGYAEAGGILLIRRGGSGGMLGEVEESGIGHTFGVPTIVDLDGDGWTDLLMASRGGERDIQIFWNLGSTVDIPAESPGGLHVVAVTPNPAPGPIHVDVDGLTRGELIGMDVVDVGGRRIGTTAPVTVDAARMCLTWDGRARDGRPIASGIYWLRVSSGGRMATTRVTVVR